MKGYARGKGSYFIIIGFLCTIALLAFVFHYPIRIVDALSADPVPGFGISISPLRVITEPFPARCCSTCAQTSL